MRLETLVVRMAEAVVRVREEMPLDGRAAGDEALPERALAGGCRDGVLAATEDERAARQRRGDPEHVGQAGSKVVVAEGGQAVRVDLVVGRDAMSVVHHQNSRPRARSVGMRRVPRNAVLLLREHACDDPHRSLLARSRWYPGL